MAIDGIADTRPFGDGLGLFAVQRELFPDIDDGIVSTQQVEETDFDIGEEVVNPTGLDPARTVRPSHGRDVVGIQPRAVISTKSPPATFLQVAGDQRPRRRNTSAAPWAHLRSVGLSTKKAYAFRCPLNRGIQYETIPSGMRLFRRV